MRSNTRCTRLMFPGDKLLPMKTYHRREVLGLLGGFSAAAFPAAAAAPSGPTLMS